jgi:hypothetical protein
MMRNLLSILAVAGTFLSPPAALAQHQTSPLGSTVRVIMSDGARLSGELLAAQRDSSWLLEGDVIRAISLDDVSRAQVRGRGMDSGRILLWSLIGGVVTGAALTSACSGVAEDCGGVFVASMLSWGLVGGIAAGITQSPHRWVDPRPEVLAPYARFPQGLPPHFTR